MSSPILSLRRAILGLLATLLLSASLTAKPAAPLPLESFFAEADMTALRLSPDGHYLAFLTTLGTGKVGIALRDLATGKIEALVAAKDENIKGFHWKGNDCIVYGGDLGGNESAAYRSITLSKRKVISLAESFRERISDNVNQASLIDPLEFDANNILVGGNKTAGSSNFRIWKLNVRTGERRAVDAAGSAPDILGYVVDTAGVLRARHRYVGETVVYEVRPKATGDFVQVAVFPINDPRWDYLHFAADNETLYLINREKSDTGVLQSLNVRTRELSPPLLHFPDGEISEILQSWDRTKLYGAIYETDKVRMHFFDPEQGRLQATIDASLPQTQNFIVSRSQDEQVLVVLATNDRDPGTYYLLDRRNPRLMALGKVKHQIDPAQMRPMEPIHYTARDGLVIHGYLTRPAGAEGRPVPLIVNPHGGPFGIRDSWSFNDEVQFLANRGYAVLQINYRGSGGYGLQFQQAGKREWGGRMQDDLTDGVQWAIAQGITTAGQVAIYGASYGGYAALAGVAFTPDLYRCAINYVGVSDLNRITSWGERFGRSSDLFYKEWVGDDRQYKRDRSPVNFVERIKVPTLHAYGYNDPRVDFDHWKRLEPELKKHGKTYEIIIEANEGHGFRNEATRLNFYRRMEAFLARYFPAA